MVSSENDRAEPSWCREHDRRPLSFIFLSYLISSSLPYLLIGPSDHISFLSLAPVNRTPLVFHILLYFEFFISQRCFLFHSSTSISRAVASIVLYSTYLDRRSYCFIAVYKMGSQHYNPHLDLLCQYHQLLSIHLLYSLLAL